MERIKPGGTAKPYPLVFFKLITELRKGCNLRRAVDESLMAGTVAQFHEAYAADREFMIPEEIVRRELAGESAVKLWREHLGLTQQELASRAGISKPYLSQIESGQRQGTVETLSAIAVSLNVPLDVLIN